jgi:hypothetical protein
MAALLSKTPVLMGGVMLIEAVVLFAGVQVPRRRRQARRGAANVAHLETDEDREAAAKRGTAKGGHGEAGHGDGAKPPAVDKKKSVEINVLDFKGPEQSSPAERSCMT